MSLTKEQREKWKQESKEGAVLFGPSVVLALLDALEESEKELTKYRDLSGKPQCWKVEHMALKWSKERPLVEGFYFFRRDKYIDVCHVRRLDIETWETIPAREKTEWAGPIGEPEK